jgi:osmotically-inducible protein OsmY
MSGYLRQLGGLSSAFILTGALAGCATYGKSGVGDRAGDANVSAEVQTLFDQHSELGAPNSINVQTLDHVVYLNGTVSQGLQSREAETLALQATGATRVVNLIGVSR